MHRDDDGSEFASTRLVLAVLERKAEEWAKEVDLASIIAKSVASKRRAEVWLRAAFMEGYLRGYTESQDANLALGEEQQRHSAIAA